MYLHSAEYIKEIENNFQRIQNLLSILINKEERRKCLVQNSLTNLKYLITSWKGNRENQGPVVVSLEIKDGGKRLETTMMTTDFMNFEFRMSRTTFYYILNRISDQIERRWVVEEPVPQILDLR